MQLADCPLCREDGGAILWRGPLFRVIDARDADYPGFTRVIWHAHQAEMTQLSPAERDVLMRAVYAVEQTLIDVFAPDKINLASLGNMVPHVHWHVIPRWRDDRHFPDAVWATPRVTSGAETTTAQARQDRIHALLPTYHHRLTEALNAIAGIATT